MDSEPEPNPVSVAVPLSELFVQTPDASRTLRALGQSRQSVPIARQFHMDAQGSTQAQTGAAGSGSGSGAGIATFTFDAFGNTLAQGSGNTGTGGSGESGDDGVGANPLRWLGGLGYWQGENGDGASGSSGSDRGDSGIGLTYVRQRWLDSGTGQWLSVDPVDSEPRYNYAQNSPTINTDVQGTQVDAAEDFADKHWRLYPRRPADIVIDKAHVRHVSQALFTQTGIAMV